jgi:hypothetical protein
MYEERMAQAEFSRKRRERIDKERAEKHRQENY